MTEKTESILSHDEILKTLTEAKPLLFDKGCHENSLAALVEKAIEITHSDLAAYYQINRISVRKTNLCLIYKKFRRPLPEILPGEGELVSFILDCRETVLKLSSNEDSDEKLFSEILLHPSMKSGVAIPIISETAEGVSYVTGILYVNSKTNNFYNRSRFLLLENLSKLAMGFIKRCDNEDSPKNVPLKEGVVV
ncbi:MAG: GAF domain-containing protein [Spirochaetales bacterium]|nr:GAF domain-containing protein [Spirochaetales bacterium]